MARRKMDPTWKTKWVKALRSGDYEQGRGQLRNNQGGFCCLGVLTDLCIEEGVVDGRWLRHGYAPAGTEYPEEAVLPKDVAVAVEAEALMPRLEVGSNEGNLISRLIRDNDGDATFDQIADTIEAML